MPDAFCSLLLPKLARLHSPYWRLWLPAGPVRADIPGPGGGGGRRPRSEPPTISTIRFKIDPNTKVAQLQIPKHLLAQIAGRRASTEPGVFGLRTILAGLAMSAAAVSMVFVLRRRPALGRSPKVAAASVVALAVTFGAIGFALADVVPPTPAVDPRVVLEVINDAKGITLILPPDMAPQLGQLVVEAENATADRDQAPPREFACAAKEETLGHPSQRKAPRLDPA